MKSFIRESRDIFTLWYRVMTPLTLTEYLFTKYGDQDACQMNILSKTEFYKNTC